MQKKFKISLLFVFCITALLGCSSETEILDEPDYYKSEQKKEINKENLAIENKNAENEQKSNENNSEKTTKITPPKTSAIENAEEKDKNSTVSNSNTIAPLVGLGDTKDSFINEYGKDLGEGMISRFSNDYILVMFLNKRAYNIKLQFEMTSEPSWTMDKSMEVTKKYIPSDSKLIREYIDVQDIGVPRKVMEYKSQKVSELFSGSDGKFVVVYNYLEGDQYQVIGLTIGVGDTP
ncbi:hypothetical protein [Neobacillus drentensis]|uniref:hypothetical protein n=1 Tax=Neobacillus drentensis TaxID=220684 RepID=UPI00082629FC|nr:hypothetical protein [Neobacillus drentensis]